MVPDEECHDVCTCYVSTFFEGFLCEPLCPKLIDKEECEPGWEPLKKKCPRDLPNLAVSVRKQSASRLLASTRSVCIELIARLQKLTTTMDYAVSK